DGRLSTLFELFERSVRRWPDAVAVDVPPAVGRPQRQLISYAALDRQSALLARAVLPSVGGGGVVAIFLPRTTERLYAAQLAVLRTASAYICLDPALPDAQLAYILRDSTAGVVLTDAEGAERVRRSGYPGPVIQVDRPFGVSTAPRSAPPSPAPP